MQILIMDRADVPGADATPVAEVSVETEHLAHECSDEEQGVAVKLAVSPPSMFRYHCMEVMYVCIYTGHLLNYFK